MLLHGYAPDGAVRGHAHALSLATRRPSGRLLAAEAGDERDGDDKAEEDEDYEQEDALSRSFVRLSGRVAG